MKPEELPEDSLTESLLEKHKELIDKYFGGEVPTEKQQKDALAFLARTSVMADLENKSYDAYDWKAYNNSPWY